MPDYEKIKRLGNGAFGEVWLVEDRALGVKRAVKFVPPHKIKASNKFLSRTTNSDDFKT